VALALWLAPASAQEGRFEPAPASSFRQRQTSEGLTIGVEAYRDREKVKQVFRKTDFDKAGVLPILVVLANDNDHALQLDRMRVNLITGDRQSIEPIAADEVLRPARIQRPDAPPRPSPFPGLGQSDVSEREFVAPVVAARSKAWGFFYFRLGKGPDRLTGAKLYLTGIRNAKTGQELLYFEIPLD
jgi:hypothetical protein